MLGTTTVYREQSLICNAPKARGLVRAGAVQHSRVARAAADRPSNKNQQKKSSSACNNSSSRREAVSGSRDGSSHLRGQSREKEDSSLPSQRRSLAP
jgi:hypothetical protein